MSSLVNDDDTEMLDKVSRKKFTKPNIQKTIMKLNDANNKKETILVRHVVTIDRENQAVTNGSSSEYTLVVSSRSK